MKQFLLTLVAVICTSFGVYADGFKITSIDPAAGTQVAGIAKGSYVKFTTNMDDEVKGVTYTFTDKTTGSVLYTTFSTSYVVANQQWEIKNYSTAVTDFKKGHEIEYKIEAYDGTAPTNSVKLGEDAITWIGDGTEEFEYSPVTVVSITPEAGTALTSTDQTDFVITYSAPVEVDQTASVIVTGQMMTAQYESITSNDDKTVWTLRVGKDLLAKTTPQLYLNVYVKDAEGRTLEGNTSGAYRLEGRSYYKYKYVCYLGSPDLTVTPAEGEVSSLKTFTLSYDQGVNFSYASTDPVRLLKDEQVVAELTFPSANVKRSNNNTMTIDLDQEITAPGTYTLVVPNGAFALGTEFEAYTSKEQRFTYTIAGEALQVVAVSPASGTELTNMPEKFTVTFNDPSAVGYGKWRVVNLSRTEEDWDYVLTQGQLKNTDGVWGGKAYFVEALKMYEGTDYQLEVFPYASVEDDQTEAEFGSNAIAKLVAAVWKGKTPAYVYSAAELESVVPNSESIIIDGIIVATFTAPLASLKAGISQGLFGDDIQCGVEASDDKMTWTITIPQSTIDQATGGLTMNVYATGADGRIVKGNVGEDENSYFLWEYNCYNGCPVPQTITPASGATVEAIDVITIEEPTGLSYAYAQFDDITVTKDGELVCTIGTDCVKYTGTGTKLTKATVTLPTAITAPGTYEVHFPVMYFMIGEEFSSVVSKAFDLVYTIDDATGLRTLSVKGETGQRYDLSGRRVDGKSKGVVIVDGKKVKAPL